MKRPKTDKYNPLEWISLYDGDRTPFPKLTKDELKECRLNTKSPIQSKILAHNPVST